MKKILLLLFLVAGVSSLHAYSYRINNLSGRDLKICVRVTGQLRCVEIAADRSDTIRFAQSLELVWISASDPNGANHTQITYGNQTTEMGGLVGDRTFDIENEYPDEKNNTSLFIKDNLD